MPRNTFKIRTPETTKLLKEIKEDIKEIKEDINKWKDILCS